MNGDLKGKCKGDAGWSDCMTFLHQPLTLGKWVSSIIKTTNNFQYEADIKGCGMTPVRAQPPLQLESTSLSSTETKGI